MPKFSKKAKMKLLKAAGIATSPSREKYNNRRIQVVLDPKHPAGHFTVPTMEELRIYRDRGMECFQIQSALEYRHWVFFQGLLRTKAISSYERQVPFVLMDAYPHPVTGRIQRATTYVADHVITVPGEDLVRVVDSKGKLTAEYVIKAKLFIQRYADTHRLYEFSSGNNMVLADFSQVKGRKRAR